MRRGRLPVLSAFLLSLLLLGPVAVAAQDFSALARLDVAQSQVRDRGEGIEVALYLSQPVPWRVYTLGDPARLVIDFREVDWRGASRAALLNADGASDLRFGALRPGWSRMVVDLARPMTVATAGMTVDPVIGTAFLDIRMSPASEADFAAALGADPDPDWSPAPARAPAEAPPPAADAPLVVAIDPGHGGIDPGAQREGVTEADVTLALGRELSEALARAGMTPVLTRDADVFVPLAERMTLARAAGADVLVSLHADALEETHASGASIYTLTEEAVDGASERMAERHERGDLLAGVDLSGQDDTVATVLMDLARLETGPQSDRLAAGLITALGDAGARLNSRPSRKAQLAVLTAADFPSVLIEVGFLSDESDRARLTDPEGRAPIVAGIVQALARWDADEAARAPLLRH